MHGGKREPGLGGIQQVLAAIAGLVHRDYMRLGHAP
jgi:hypothetical protein